MEYATIMCCGMCVVMVVRDSVSFMVKWREWESHRSDMACMLITGRAGLSCTNERMFKSEGNASSPTSESESGDCLQPLGETISHPGLETQGRSTHADLPCALSQDYPR